MVRGGDLDLELTGDDVLRIRCSRGLQLKRGSDRLFCCDAVMDFLGEVAVPERALSEPFTPAGVLPRAIMTIENLGAYVDLPMPETLLVIHQPGWNCSLSLRFMESFPSDTPIYHFGDLDPEGFEIYRYLRRVSGREIQFFVPACWRGYLKSHARALKNPWALKQDGCPVHPLLDELMASQRWLEQEVVLADPELRGELAALVQTGTNRLRQ